MKSTFILLIFTAVLTSGTQWRKLHADIITADDLFYTELTAQVEKARLEWNPSLQDEIRATKAFIDWDKLQLRAVQADNEDYQQNPRRKTKEQIMASLAEFQEHLASLQTRTANNDYVKVN